MWDQNCLIYVFLSGNLKTVLSYLKSAPSNLSNCKIGKYYEETKMLKFGTRNALFEYSWPKMLPLGIFVLEFQKNYCHIWNQHPWIFLIAKFCEKIKLPKFKTTNALFGYFWSGNWTKYSHIWNRCPWICLVAKFGG